VDRMLGGRQVWEAAASFITAVMIKKVEEERMQQTAL